MGARPFMDWLREQRKGATHEELTQLLNEAVQAVGDHGKRAEIVLKIVVKPMSKANRQTVIVVDTVVGKIPQPERSQSVFFVTPEHNLSTTDPDALPLGELKEVDPEPPILKEANKS